MSNFNIEVDDEHRIIRVTYEGNLDILNANKLVNEARSIAHNLGYNLLYDMQNSFLKASTTEMYLFPRQHELLVKPEAERVKSAAIIPPRDEQGWAFYETTSINAGLNFRIFHNEEDALKWLRG
jgi:hypothetical protein